MFSPPTRHPTGETFGSLEREILSVLETTNQLRESPEFELYKLTAKNAEVFEEIVTKQTVVLEREIVDLTNEADRLSKEIAALTPSRYAGRKLAAHHEPSRGGNQIARAGAVR